jgi:hypothetical protein
MYGLRERVSKACACVGVVVMQSYELQFDWVGSAHRHPVCLIHTKYDPKCGAAGATGGCGCKQTLIRLTPGDRSVQALYFEEGDIVAIFCVNRRLPSRDAPPSVSQESELSCSAVIAWRRQLVVTYDLYSYHVKDSKRMVLATVTIKPPPAVTGMARVKAKDLASEVLGKVHADYARDFKNPFVNHLQPLNSLVGVFLRPSVSYVCGNASCRIPVWQLIVQDCEHAPVTAEALFVRAARHALEVCGVTAAGFMARPMAYPEMLVQVIGQFIWPLYYERDSALVGKGDNRVREGIEQFNVARIACAAGPGCCDCEDCSRDAVLLAERLRTGVFEDPVLQAVQKLAEEYYALHVDASIFVPSEEIKQMPDDSVYTEGCGMNLHMYVRFVPKNTLRRWLKCNSMDAATREVASRIQPASYDLPMLVLECTDRCLGVFNPRHSDERTQFVEALYGACRVLSKDIYSDLDRCRVLNTSAIFRDESWFHHDVCYYSNRLWRDCGVAYLLPMSVTRATYGARCEDVSRCEREICVWALQVDEAKRYESDLAANMIRLRRVQPLLQGWDTFLDAQQKLPAEDTAYRKDAQGMPSIDPYFVYARNEELSVERCRFIAQQLENTPVFQAHGYQFVRVSSLPFRFGGILVNSIEFKRVTIK